MNEKTKIADRESERKSVRGHAGRRARVLGVLVLAFVLGLAPARVLSDEKESAAKKSSDSAQPSLEETRLTMDEWIETQQIISKERKDWQQGKEILAGRLDLVKKEVEALKAKLKQAQSGVEETNKKRLDLVAESDQLKAAAKQLTDAVTTMESDIRKLFKQLPEPIQTKLAPLYQRVPEDPAKTRVSAAERFQNVLGILNELNKSNNEINVSYEIHKLADGKPAEVKAIYLGLAQAYYVSARGEGGVGRPSAEGWKWEPANINVSRDILNALEILQGKQTPAFVPLPVKIQ